MKGLIVLGAVVLLAFVAFFPEDVNALIPADENGDATTSVLMMVIGAPFALMAYHFLFVRRGGKS
jgi:hypothetical protein